MRMIIMAHHQPVFSIVVLSLLYIQTFSLIFPYEDASEKEETGAIALVSCNARMDLLQRQITEQDKEIEYLRLQANRKVKIAIARLHKQLLELDKKLLRCSHIQRKFVDRQLRVKRQSADEDPLSQCTGAVKELVTKQANLTKLLEESSAELKKECSKPKLCFTQNAVMLSTGAHFFNPESLSWEAARNFCISRGMDLVAIESLEENKAIAAHGLTFGAPFTSTNAWTSGCYSSERDSWFWNSTGVNLNYTNWWRSHGTLRSDSNCIVLDSSDTTFLARNASEHRPFICEL